MKDQKLKNSAPTQEVNGKKPHPRDVHEKRQETDASRTKHSKNKDNEFADTQGYGEHPAKSQNEEKRRQRDAEINTPE